MNVYRLRPRATTLRVANGSNLLQTPGLPLAVLSLLVSMPGVASAEAFLPSMGGGGGGQFIGACPAGQNLTGFELRAGDDIDAIRPVCVTAYGPGESTAPVLTNDSGLVAAPGGLFKQVAPGWYGGPGGGIQRVLCPAVTPIVLGIDVESEGTHVKSINNIHLFCGDAVAAPSIPNAPSAIFDAPFRYPESKQTQHWESQRCPGGQVAVGVHGRAGEYLDAMGLICDPVRVASRPLGSPAPITLGRVQVVEPSGPPLPICESARNARARNSPAAPGLEAQCRAQQPPGKALGRVKSTEPAGAPVPICDAAGSARDRNSPAAPGLEKQCLALGGHLPPSAGAVNLQQLAARGAAIANDDPMSGELRNQQPDGPKRHGFDIGMAAAEGHTVWGPGKQKVLDSLPLAEQEGFKVASSFALDRNRNADLAAIGAAIDAADPILAEARGAEVDVRYWLGFDIATGLFGDPALGAKGNTATGPGSLGRRDALSAPAQRGFNAASALHLSRHY